MDLLGGCRAVGGVFVCSSIAADHASHATPSRKVLGETVSGVRVLGWGPEGEASRPRGEHRV
jgi:hypothetical protein